MILITLLSDNNDGMCRLSVKRIAKLLGRKEENVRLAIDTLEEGGELVVDRTDRGLPNSYSPAVPVVVATMNPAMTWFVDALSDKPVPRGRPRNSAEEKSPPQEGEYSDEYSPPETGEFSPADGKMTPAVGKMTPAKPDSILLRDISKDEPPTDDISKGIGGAQARRRRPHQLPDDFALDGEVMNHALAKGMTEGEASEQFQAFCNYHRAKGSVMADWHAAWRMWVGKAFQYGHVGGEKKAARARGDPPASTGSNTRTTRNSNYVDMSAVGDEVLKWTLENQ